jgi:hypothetical protein
MLRRVIRTASALGVGDSTLLERAFERALAPRMDRLDDDHDPRFLHPGRTALILMDDVSYHDPHGLATAILTESESPELACDSESDRPGDPEALTRALAEARRIPRMEDEEGLAEALVTAPDPVPVIALAEYLDQLRHLRLWADPERVRARAATASRILVPFAARVHPVLARRFEWWARRVGRT